MIGPCLGRPINSQKGRFWAVERLDMIFRFDKDITDLSTFADV